MVTDVLFASFMTKAMLVKAHKEAWTVDWMMTALNLVAGEEQGWSHNTSGSFVVVSAMLP